MPCPSHEPHDMHYHASSPAKRWPSPIRPHRHRLAAAITFLCFPSNSWAVPTNGGSHPAQLQARDSADMTPKIWTSIGVVIFVFLVLFICGYSRRIISRFTDTTGQSSRGGNDRELTADQLAGSINRNAANANNANNTTADGRPRRTRRPRRTPSQISTASLPLYMKDPGEHELVIFRAPGDLHDMPQPSATVMSSVDEDGEETSATPMRQTSPRSPMQSSTSDIPLLNRDGTARRSMSSDGSNSLHRNNSNNNSPDPRGEAPSYDEAIRAFPMQSLPLQEVDLTETPPPPALPEQPQTQGISGFRSFFNAMNPSRPSHVARANDLRIGHHRVDSNNSDVSSSGSVPQTPSRSSHRPSPSAGSFFRTLSRQRSMRSVTSSHLNSPSVISINSISSPLTHTVVRTEITYPRSGPTPEQIRAISSRDALGRFGVPYGADAIAYVASTSRQDLPPDFDAVASTANLLPSPSSWEESESADSPLPVPPEEETSPPIDAPPEEVSIVVVDEHQSSLIEHFSPTPESASLSPGNIDKSVSSRQSAVLPPPSSFRPTSTEFGSRRPESRVSSYSTQSYATTAESLPARGSQHQDASSLSPRDSPRLGAQHIPEPSNASTIKPTTTQPRGSHSLLTNSP